MEKALLTENGIEKVPENSKYLDVRESPETRKRVNKIIKINNSYKGSKYMKPASSVMGNSYN